MMLSAKMLLTSILLIFILDVEVYSLKKEKNLLPMVINTWPFSKATYIAWDSLTWYGSALDAVEHGCSKCERDQCDGTVGYGGSPNEDGETTLDAMIMDGKTHEVGAVGCLKRVKHAISVARKVMEHTTHTLLVGDDATRFAVKMGFKEENLQTNKSRTMWEDWKKNNCQPNSWKNVSPNPRSSCGPYRPIHRNRRTHVRRSADKLKAGHDTIGMIAIDHEGHIVAGTSTNGRRFKIPGRVGDSPVAGAGAYADNDIGAAAATGDGDIMMRFLPSYRAVMNMELGMCPRTAARNALKRIVKYYPNYNGAIVAVNKRGEYGAAAHGFTNFKYCVVSRETKGVLVIPVDPL